MSDHIVDANKTTTPWTDEREFHRDSGEHDHLDMVVAADDARNLERRLRIAEALIEEVVSGYEAECDSAFDWVAWYDKASAHLTAAKEEAK